MIYILINKLSLTFEIKSNIYNGVKYAYIMKCCQRVNLELIVADYDRIGSSDPIGKVLLGYNRKGLELKHWKEMIENPRRPIVHWHVLKVSYHFPHSACLSIR